MSGYRKAISRTSIPRTRRTASARPKSALQYEVGIKFSFLDDHVVLNTSAFDVSRNNVASAVTLNGVESVVFDSQRTKGVEAALDTKLNDQWHVLANVTYQDAIITDNPQGITSVGNHPQGAPAVHRQSLDELSVLDRGDSQASTSAAD